MPRRYNLIFLKPSFTELQLPQWGMSAQASKADQLERRMIRFSGEIIQISARLPRNLQAQHIARQILRCGSAVAANYGEARGAESRPDFVHKLRIVLKELNETAVWLELLLQTTLCPRDTVVVILSENRELCKIIAASIKTARHTPVQEK